MNIFLYHYIYIILYNIINVSGSSFIAVDMAALKAGAESVPRKVKFGRLLPDSCIQFDKAESSSLNLTGKAKG